MSSERSDETSQKHRKIRDISHTLLTLAPTGVDRWFAKAHRKPRLSE